MAEIFAVQVCYANPEKMVLQTVLVSSGTTIDQVIELSGILNDSPEINLAENSVGIFGKITTRDTVLEENDRVEIYRPLPK